MDDFVHINLGNILTIVTFLVMGAGTIYTLKNDVRYQSQRLDNIEDTMRKIQDVLIKVAVQDERLAAMDQRMMLQGQRIDDVMRTIGTRMDDLSRRVDSVRPKI